MYSNQPQHRAEPSAETIEENRKGENLKRLHGVTVVAPGTGRRAKPSIMAVKEEQDAA